MPNITARQNDLLNRLRQADPTVSVAWDDVRGVASSVRGALAEGGAQAEPAATLDRFLEEFGELFGPRDAKRHLRPHRSRKDELGWSHLEYRQVWTPPGDVPLEREIEIYNSRLSAHFLPDGALKEVQSSCWRDVEVSDEVRIKPTELKEALRRDLTRVSGFRALEQQMAKRDERDFPVMQAPRIVVYPWRGGFRLAYSTFAFAVVDAEDPSGRPTGKLEIAFGQLFVDASTGERILFAPTRHHVDVADAGTGVGVIPLGTPATRNLNIVHDSAVPRSRLRDTTHNREIVTYDAAGNSAWVSPGLAGQLEDGTVPVSEDTDKNWNRVAADTTDAERTASQQPEVDAHFNCEQIYEWFDSLAGAGGRDGWDNNNYSAPLVPNQTIRVAAHTHNVGAGTSRSVNAFADRQLVSGHWVAYLAFFDGDPTATCTVANDVGYDYLSGSPFIVAHEYQHQITNFNFEDAAGNPGLMNSGWLAAVHEGLSDVFGGLYSENWIPGPEFATSGLVFRNIAYPRDPNSWVNRTGGSPCGLDNHNKDHFADRNLDNGFLYDRGTILAHCAYLTAQGGVHQRTSRVPALIPVSGLGRETVGGRSHLRAARIWYRALTYYFSTHGVLTGIPLDDEDTFRRLRNACVSAAQDLYTFGSAEHHHTVTAWYAVGLHPAGLNYGPDVTFLPWGAAWPMSRPYIGLSSPDWASLDLYIKNGAAASGWNAVINVLDASGNPTEFENDVYCRVRNVGDQQADIVSVTFEYAKVGTAPVVWQRVLDKNGSVQTLTVNSLAAGQANFPDSSQESPPATARIKWAIPPLASGEVVDHFCLRATVTSLLDSNRHNNTVQSNISYAAYTPASGFAMAFMVGNPTSRDIPLDLRVLASLPKGWKVTIKGRKEIKRLKKGEERTLEVAIEMEEGADRELDAPFDGDVQGELFGSMSAPITGTLTNTGYDDGQLRGRFSGIVGVLGSFTGEFNGAIDLRTAEINGRVSGVFQCSGSGLSDRICAGLKGCLRPWRRVDISQWLGGAPLGGLTVQVQVPMRRGPCAIELPPTDTHVQLRRPARTRHRVAAKPARRGGSRKRR